MVHGAAGSTQSALAKNLWSPAAVGRELRPGAEQPDAARAVPRVPDHRQQHRRARWPRRSTPKEIGGDHFRSSAVFLTQTHPKQTEGSDVHVGISLDQMYAQRFGQDTPIPSMQLCIENVDQAGGCAYGYACVYTDTISWASPTEPLPMIRDPRVGVRSAVRRRRRRRRARGATARTDRSILDWVTGRGRAICKRRSAPSDRQRMDQYLDDIREIERRIQQRRGAQHERRAARAAGRAGRRARLVRRAREADVRPAGARVRRPT